MEISILFNMDTISGSSGFVGACPVSSSISFGDIEPFLLRNVAHAYPVATTRFLRSKICSQYIVVSSHHTILVLS